MARQASPQVQACAAGGGVSWQIVCKAGIDNFDVNFHGLAFIKPNYRLPLLLLGWHTLAQLFADSANGLLK